MDIPPSDTATRRRCNVRRLARHRQRVCAGVALFVAAFGVSPAFSAALTPEPDSSTYNFVTHYRVVINAPRADVWPVLVDLKSWMYEFELATLSGQPGQEGQVLRLYAGQDFKVQVLRVVPDELLVLANLPMTFEDEFVTGIGVMTLHETDSGTEVALTMSRRYTWNGEGDNPLRVTRSSAAFQDRTRAMWQDRFLERLKMLAESKPAVVSERAGGCF